VTAPIEKLGGEEHLPVCAESLPLSAAKKTYLKLHNTIANPHILPLFGNHKILCLISRIESDGACKIKSGFSQIMLITPSATVFLMALQNPHKVAHQKPLSSDGHIIHLSIGISYHHFRYPAAVPACPSCLFIPVLVITLPAVPVGIC